MATGRCAGCGFTDSSKKVEVHALACQGYLELFRTAPGQCLDPVVEQARYRNEEDTSEARAQRRDKRLSDRYAETEYLSDLAARRWQRPPDILAD